LRKVCVAYGAWSELTRELRPLRRRLRRIQATAASAGGRAQWRGGGRNAASYGGAKKHDAKAAELDALTYVGPVVRKAAMKRAKRLFDGVYRADGGDRVAARFGWMWEAMIRERVRDDFAIRRQLRPATPIKSVDDAADDDSSSSVGFGDHSDLDEEMSLKPAPFDWRTGSVEEKISPSLKPRSPSAYPTRTPRRTRGGVRRDESESDTSDDPNPNPNPNTNDAAAAALAEADAIEAARKKKIRDAAVASATARLGTLLNPQGPAPAAFTFRTPPSEAATSPPSDASPPFPFIGFTPAAGAARASASASGSRGGGGGSADSRRGRVDARWERDASTGGYRTSTGRRAPPGGGPDPVLELLRAQASGLRERTRVAEENAVRVRWS
jgi:hypothetical protein